MGRRGDELFNPVTKTRVVFVETPADNAGHELSVDWYVPPGEGLPVAPHYHAGPVDQVAETFTVISGNTSMRVGRRQLTVSAPSAIDVRFNEVHTHPVNAGRDELHVRQTGKRDQPELEMLSRVEQFLETLVALSQQGKVNRKGDVSNPLQAAITINDLLLDPTFLPGLSPGLQKGIFGALAQIARWAGYQPLRRPRIMDTPGIK